MAKRKKTAEERRKNREKKERKKKKKLERIQKRERTLAEKTLEKKKLVLDQLEVFPVVTVATKRAGVSTTTYYRWREEDVYFKKMAQIALENGVQRINDLAESKLIQAINDGDPGMIKYWLNNRHPAYNHKMAQIIIQNQSALPDEHKEKIAQLLKNWKEEKKKPPVEYSEDSDN